MIDKARAKEFQKLRSFNGLGRKMSKFFLFYKNAVVLSEIRLSVPIRNFLNSSLSWVALFVCFIWYNYVLFFTSKNEVAIKEKHEKIKFLEASLYFGFWIFILNSEYFLLVSFFVILFLADCNSGKSNVVWWIMWKTGNFDRFWGKK